MNELQVALAIIGILAVVGILIYNRLQERKFRRQTEAGFSKPGRDALLDVVESKVEVSRVWSGQSEPVFSEYDTTLDAGPHTLEPTFGVEPELAPEPVLLRVATEPAQADPVQSGSLSPVSAIQKEAPPQQTVQSSDAELVSDVFSSATPSREQPHNELIEFKVQMKCVDGMPSEDFGDILSRCRALGKPVRWRALPLGGLDSVLPQGGLGWEVLQPQSKKRYLEVIATMQLADRKGAASKEELSSLCDLAHEAALAHGWQSKCDDLVESMARAQSLDKFCADVDVLIGLNIISRGTAFLPSAKIRLEAEAANMQLQADGTYHLLDSRNETLFTLSSVLGNREPQPFVADAPNTPETKGMTLLFDVPRVPDGLKTFDGMVALGRKLSHDSGGLLVDDNMRPLTDAGIEKIRAQLAQIYDKMESRGIPPGGRLALRLFS